MGGSKTLVTPKRGSIGAGAYIFAHASNSVGASTRGLRKRLADWVEWGFACAVSSCITACLLGTAAAAAPALRHHATAMVWLLSGGSGSSVSGVGANATAAVAVAGGMVLQRPWDFLARDCAAITALPAFPGMLAVAYYFLAAMPLFALDMLPGGAIARFRLQRRCQAREVSWEEVRKTVLLTAYSMFGFQLPGLAWQLHSRGPWLYRRGEAEVGSCMEGCDFALPAQAPSLAEVAVHLFICLLVMDLQYFCHHKLHHRGQWRF